MLCWTLQSIESLSTIVANILSTFSLIAIFITLFKIYQNRFSTKNIQLTVTNIYQSEFNLSIANFTDKDFNIIGIELEINGTQYPAKEAVPRYTEIRNICFPAHYSDDIYCMFSVDPNTLPKVLVFKLKTTQGDLKFKIKQANTKPNNGKTSNNKKENK